MASDLVRLESAYVGAKAMMGQSIDEAGKLLEFFKLRARIEADYARELEKLSRAPGTQADGKENARNFPSTVQVAFRHLGSAAAALAAEHRNFADTLASSVQQLQALKTDGTQRCKLLRGRLRQTADGYAQAKAALPKAKKSYAGKCQKLELSRAAAGHNARHGKFQTARKGLEGLIPRKEETLKQVEKEVEDEYQRYRDAVSDLERKRQGAEAEFSATYREFEDFELRRSMQARDNLIEYLQAETVVAHTRNKLCKEMEASVSSIKANVDIEQAASRAREVRWKGCRLQPNEYKDIVFGVPLQFHLEVTGRDVPLIVERTAQLVEEHGLSEKGFYRVPGQRSAILRLQAEFEANQNAVLYQPPAPGRALSPKPPWSPATTTAPTAAAPEPTELAPEPTELAPEPSEPSPAPAGAEGEDDLSPTSAVRADVGNLANLMEKAFDLSHPTGSRDLSEVLALDQPPPASSPSASPPVSAEFPRDHQHSFAQPTDDIKNVGGLLKLYLAELPEPLFRLPVEERLANSGIADKEERVRDITRRLGKVPRCNRATLKFLLEHLRRVAANKDANSMDEKNLGIVFSPGVFGSDEVVTKDTLLLMNNDTALAFMIENAPEIFLVWKSPASIRHIDAPKRNDSLG